MTRADPQTVAVRAAVIEAAHPLLESADGSTTSPPWELIAGASHDLRNPICSIRLMIDALADALGAMAPVAGQSGVKLIGEVSPSAGFVRADADRLLRVLLNLIANAIRHSPRSGTVLVTAAGDGQMLNSGPGIPREQHEEIFKPFVSSETRGARPDHAGLGLAICRTIIECHGGRIWIGPSPRGARVCVAIPATQPAPGAFPRAVPGLEPAVVAPLTVPAMTAPRLAADG